MDYTAVARSNYVKFKDLEGLEKVLESIDISIEPHVTGLRHALISESGYGWPSTVYDDDDPEDEGVDFDPLVHIVPYLAEGEVLIMMESGSEGARYAAGYAKAYTSDGREVSIFISDIYKLAAEEFGVDIDSISRAEY